MKYSILAFLFTLVFVSSPTFAAAFAGKYQLQVSNGLSGLSGNYVFLMNSQGEIKIIEEESDYYMQSLRSSLFFTDLEVELEWGSDEDVHFFSFTLSELNDVLVMTKLCSLYVDGPNDVHDFEELDMKLQKWSKSEKQYEDVVVVQSQAKLRDCQKTLARRHLN